MLVVEGVEVVELGTSVVTGTATEDSVERVKSGAVEVGGSDARCGPATGTITSSRWAPQAAAVIIAIATSTPRDGHRLVRVLSNFHRPSTRQSYSSSSATVRAMTARLRRGFWGWAAIAVMVAGCANSDAVDERSGAAPARSDEGVEAMTRVEYGDHADAFGELWLPITADATSPVPVVVLIHGGFWRDGFFLDLMDPLIPSLLEREYAVWNIEYRRVGAGGGFPATFGDVADGVDQLAEISDSAAVALDLSRVGIVGHSAGGQLAVWAAGRSALPAGTVGSEPMVSPVVAVAQAGVLDLIGCADQGVGGSACIDLIGGSPTDEPERYAVTSPAEMVPFDAVVVAVHGELDRIVPATQSVTFVDRATGSGMDATYAPIATADHFSNLDPDHPAWVAVLDALDRSL